MLGYPGSELGRLGVSILVRAVGAGGPEAYSSGAQASREARRDVWGEARPAPSHSRLSGDVSSADRRGQQDYFSEKGW